MRIALKNNCWYSMLPRLALLLEFVSRRAIKRNLIYAVLLIWKLKCFYLFFRNRSEKYKYSALTR